jgi:hypothetical protein
MRNKTITLTVLLVLGCGSMLAITRFVNARPATADATKKWEYCHLHGSYTAGDNRYKAQVTFPSNPERADEIESTMGGLGALNRLGADGWELAVTIQETGSQREYILKRPRP